MRFLARAASLAAVLLVAATPGWAVDSYGLERLALCQDSWLEWKDRDPGRFKRYVDSIQSGFVHGKEAAFTPKSPQTMAGFPVIQIYPESIGMGVGFSVLVEASLDRAKKLVEQRVGRSLKCERPSDNMRGCELQLGDKKNISVMSEDSDRATKILIGCFYFYAK